MLEQAKEMVARAGFNPYRVPYNNRDFLDLASNNYLGLAEDARVKRAAIEAAERYGASLCGTPVASGFSEYAQTVAARLAGFVGLPQALLFPSCYQANNGVFSALCGKDDLILIDKQAHSSLIEGARAARCKLSPFLHNNMEHLEKLLRRAGDSRRVYVVTESVFSTEGSIAPLAEIAALCERYGAVPVVDDSHGIGVLGQNGRGVLEHFGLRSFRGLYTASLGKALANMGGMVAGDEQTMEYLSYLCPHLVYSTALTPPVLGGIMGALDVIESDFTQRSARMWRYKKMLAEVVGMGGEAPINSVACGRAEDAVRLSGELYRRGILSTPFIEPSVPKNACVVRLIAGAGLAEERVAWAAEQLRAII